MLIAWLGFLITNRLIEPIEPVAPTLTLRHPTPQKWDDDMALCAEAVRHLNRLKPKFVIVCGDLVHHLPSMYPDTDPEIRTRQVGTTLMGVTRFHLVGGWMAGTRTFQMVHAIYVM